jgi:hypothetical protein
MTELADFMADPNSEKYTLNCCAAPAANQARGRNGISIRIKADKKNGRRKYFYFRFSDCFKLA